MVEVPPEVDVALKHLADWIEAQYEAGGPVAGEKAARAVGAAHKEGERVARTYRSRYAKELADELGSYQKAGDALGLTKQTVEQLVNRKDAAPS